MRKKLTEEMKILILVLFSNFTKLEAVNEHVKMEVCQIQMTNHAPDFLKLKYQKWFRKMTFEILAVSKHKLRN